MSDINANMNVSGGPKVNVKQVGYAKVDLSKRTEKPTNVDDVVAPSMERFKNPPRARDGACQAPLSGKQTPPAATYTKPTPDTD